MTLREEADYIIEKSIKAVLPDEAVAHALRNKKFENGNLYIVSVGKAAWQMAKTSRDILGDKIKTGIVLTKYGHIKEEIKGMKCFEAGHPVPDANSFLGTQAILDMVTGLTKKDTILFLLSGGGSSLFEKPLIPEKELEMITRQLLSSGADITEINTIRKRLSAVKGGKFAKICQPAKVYTVALSDVLGNHLDMIASGPSVPDPTTCKVAMEIVEKYHLTLSPLALKYICQETPKEVNNVEYVITGSVSNLCKAAENAAKELGYETIILTDQLDCEAKEAGAFLAAIAKSHQNCEKDLCFIAGGETVVHVIGNGLGGRNQELVLAAARKIAGLENTAIFSIGSDGTDGPTDAAGGYCDGMTEEILEKKGVKIHQVLMENNAYYALKETGGLIVTGATGTNVNDVSVVLIRKGRKLIN